MAQSQYSRSPSPFQQKILAIFDGLSPKQHRLARYFLDNEDVIAFASANEVGNESDASAATVVRFARALGYEGYTDLQDEIRSNLTRSYTSSQKLEQRLSQGGFANHISASIAEVNIRNIEQTLQNVSVETLDRAVDALLGADRVLIFSGGLSSSAAVMAQHSLTMLGIQARVVINGGLTQTLEMSTISPKDIVFVISIWRYLKDTVEVAQYAAEAGATTIALTDSLVSPVARIADYTFIAATERAAHSRSLTGLITLIDLINATIISKRPEESTRALKRIDDLYYQQGKLLEE